MHKLRSKLAFTVLCIFLVNIFMPLVYVKADIKYIASQLSSVPINDGQFMVVYIKTNTNNYGTNRCVFPGNGVVEDTIEYIQPQTVYSTYAEAKAVMDTLTSTSNKVVAIIGYRDPRFDETGRQKTIIDAQYALLDLNVKRTLNGHSGASFNTNIYTDNMGTGYINGSYGADAALISYNFNNTYAKLKISGLVGYASKGTSTVHSENQLNYEVLPVSIIKSPSYYIVQTNSDNTRTLYHQLTNDVSAYNCYSSKLSLGPAPTYLAVNTKYYSYDGNYFYTDIITMLSDYKANGFNNAVNKDEPYYNYYLYLSNRTKSSYNGDDINNYLINVKHYTSKPTVYPATGSQSMLYNEGNNFVNAQNQFGVNAMLSFALSINESGWGQSNIAITKNNIFGHGAYDYDPGSGADTYASVASSINYHADRFISAGYANPNDYRYYGSHFGNKASGMNVKYASDPYWGEKMVQHYYTFDKANGMGDYELYKIGIKKTDPSNASLAVRKEPNRSSSTIYSLKNSSVGVVDMPIIILDSVQGETINGSNIWYKIQTDPVLDDSRTMVSVPASGHTYNWSNNYGYVHSSYIKLIGVDVPSITAHDKIVLQNTSFDPTEDVLAYDKVDGDITDKITTTSNDVNTSVPGQYHVTYRVENAIHKVTTLTIAITVRSNQIPVINASDATVIQSDIFNIMDNVTATDSEDGTITNKVTYTGTVDTMDDGTHPITYSVTDNDGNTVNRSITVTVTRNDKPVIRGTSNKTIDEGTNISLTSGVTAMDAEDGELTSSINISGSVNSSVPGSYNITYSATDSNNNTTTKTITVTVTAAYQEVSGNFYLHSFSWDSQNQRFNITGYLTIKGINNTYAQTITYEMLLQNVETNQKYTLSLDRWKQGDPYPIKAASEGNYNYTDSWFKGALDTSSIPQGDYQAYIIAKSSGKKTTAVFRNVFSREIVRKATANSGRGYLFRTNYYLKTMPIEIFIRNQGLISDVTPPTAFDNMFNSYKRLNLTNINNSVIFDVKGTSFNIMGNYAVNQAVERQLIFEDTSTFVRTSFDLGYTDTANVYGDAITLRVSDGKDKTRAWFDKQINITSLNVGTYTIYIRTKAGSVDDYGELNDITFRTLSKSITVSGKTYQLTMNANRRGRIELKVS